MNNKFDLRKFLAENKIIKEAMVIVGHTEEEKIKNAEELHALAQKLGIESEIKYYDHGGVSGVDADDVSSPNAGQLSDLQDKQFKEYQEDERYGQANRTKDGKKLKKLTVGGKTYAKEEEDPAGEGRVLTIEKYSNGYYITGGIYSDYGDGDEPKEQYSYAIDLKGNKMDEEDLDMHEQMDEIDADLLKRAQNTPAPKDAAARLAKTKAAIDRKNKGTLQVSMGSNAEQEQKVIDIAKAAIALMDEQPKTSAVEALKSVLGM